jgi:hypothetical protein
MKLYLRKIKLLNITGREKRPQLVEISLGEDFTLLKFGDSVQAGCDPVPDVFSARERLPLGVRLSNEARRQEVEGSGQQ